MPLRKSTFLRALALTLCLICAGIEPCFAASGEFVDKAASVMAVFIIIVVPIAGVILFWLVHVMPEKIAEKRHHPQKDAIHVLCLLSLVFGGLLWPLAWLWAYSKPVLHQLAYGRDKHDKYYVESEAEGTGSVPSASARLLTVHEELRRLRHDLEALEKRGGLSVETQGMRDRLASLESRSGPETPVGGGA
jgi:CBS domain containing-hemolysin-like protein